MPKTVLLTNGRLPKALELARALSGAGCRVLIAEPFRWHLSRVSRSVARCFEVRAPVADRRGYIDDLLGIVSDEGVDLVVPVSEEAMYAAAIRDRLPERAALHGMDQSHLLALHDKHRFATTARGYGLDTPDTAALGDVRATGIAAAGRYVVKPVFSCSGRGVSIHARGEPLPEVPPDDAFIVQAFVPGSLYSTFSIAHQGRVLVTVVYRAAVMSGTVAVCFERVESPAIDRWVETFASAEQWSGFLSFDFVVDETGRAFAIECNPRMTSGAHFVEPADLARAVLTPADAGPVRFRDQRVRQQFYPTLTETQLSLFRGGGAFRRNLGHLVSAPDVTWARGDRLPLILMPATSWQILRLSIMRGLSFGEAATLDIGWRPDPEAKDQPAALTT